MSEGERLVLEALREIASLPQRVWQTSEEYKREQERIAQMIAAFERK